MKGIVHRPLSPLQREAGELVVAAVEKDYRHAQMHKADGSTCPEGDFSFFKVISVFDTETRKPCAALAVARLDETGHEVIFPVALVPDEDLRGRLIPIPDLLSEEGKAAYAETAKLYLTLEGLEGGKQKSVS